MMSAPNTSWASLRRCLALMLLLLPATATLPPQRSLADERLRQSSVIWKAVDNCSRAAAKAYPDYTPESLAKREAHRRLCLRQSNLPGGDDPPAPPTAGGGGASK